MKPYKIINQSWMLRDGEEKDRNDRLRFHAKYNDYFATLATILDLIHQDEVSLKKRNALLFEKIKKDLMFLQDNYVIRGKEKRQKKNQKEDRR